MSKSLKDDIIKAIYTHKLYEDAENGVCYNDPANQKVNWSQVGIQMLHEFKSLYLYNVQLTTSSKMINKFIYAYDREDAIKLVTKRFKEFEFEDDDIYCQRVDPIRGMMFQR